ncbi:UDP-N-acetylmuramoyl-tripeptide--D-alanyl-D-alanine ligase [Asanoa sp. NPDC049573]|uniref:UDP-N-acetylmuramoyl-tripeptide--D-alanyl-D- alanine ligase n=1 Tax=Asanoa sp. NPDC049573 TaxID=3155396 RepID=UPI00341E4995
MIKMRLDEVAAAVGGRLAGADPAAVLTGDVEYDSRKVGPGGLFVAFPGEKVDGHEFAAAAVAAGATAVLGSRPVEGVPMVLVDDPLAALAALARVVVSRLPDLSVIGLTGSSGKTTTKDLVAQLAARLGPTVAPAGSLNNELGYPHTVLRSDEATRFLVLEMGARGAGHISYLAGIARPRVGVVLNVGVAHIGEFGSVEGIAAAKGELPEAVPVDGVAVLNADDEWVRKMAVRTRGKVVLFGESADADVRADEVTLDERGRASYTLRVARGSVPVRLRVSGRHQVANSLAAAAVARELGMPLRELGEALGELELRSARRMDLFDRPDGVTVIDDSYNANPASASAALRALAAVGAGRRTVAVLGYMAELGEFERSGHEEVGRLAAELGVDRLVVVGDAAGPIHDGAIAHPGWEGRSVVVGDQAAAIDALHAELRPGDVVLVKGSRYRTWDVADALRADGHAA